MSKTVDYYYALASPWSYLGHDRFRDIVARTGAEARYMPIEVPVLFPAMGTLSLKDRPESRKKNRLAELARWHAHLGIALTLQPRHFPVPDTAAAGMVIAAQQGGDDGAALTSAFMRAVWAEERDIADIASLDAIAAAEGHDGPALRAAAETDAVSAQYRANTNAAIAANVFGVPAWVIDGEMFWGQDRLDFIERALG
jgi:2-hydroxychromene-2-carboxylate isomerase